MNASGVKECGGAFHPVFEEEIFATIPEGRGAAEDEGDGLIGADWGVWIRSVAERSLRSAEKRPIRLAEPRARKIQQARRRQLDFQNQRKSF